MKTKVAPSLLVDAPSGRHFCQIHRDPACLSAEVSAFTDAGLRRGDGVVLIAGETRTGEVIAAVGEERAAEAMRAGQLIVHDAATTLARFWDGGSLDWDGFRATIGGVLDGARAMGFRKVRAYGEMVNLLWRDGKRGTAIQLEEYWNHLAREYKFCLFCGYEIDGLDLDSFGGPIHEIGRVHSDFPMSSDDERLSAAIDAATRDVFGVPVSSMLTHSAPGDRSGEQRLPSPHRTVLWLQRQMPHAVARVLKRARVHYGA